MSILGLDLGTSSVKALLLPEGDGVPTVASVACAVSTPRPGWVEADPTEWAAAAAAAVRGVRAQAGGEAIGAIGLAGHMHGVVLCDATGRPVRPAITWADRRAVDALEAWRSLPADRREALGNPLVPGMAGPLLAWLAVSEPAAPVAARWALQAKDWLRLILTGEAATEPSDASATLLWDLAADGWATDVAAAVGVDTDLLAPMIASDAQAGVLTTAGAELLGLAPGIPVYAGGGDTAAALLGAGIQTAGRRLLNVGTGAQLVTAVATPATSPMPSTHRYRAAGAGWYAMGAVQNAGLALGWARDLVGVGWEKAEAEAFAGATAGATDPLFIPHLTGERTPLLDAGARGAWIGLALEHDRGDLLRAAYEGVAHAIRHARQAMEEEGARGSGALRLLGGGSLRPAYRQLLADVLGEPLELVAVADATALGAARLAGGVTPEPTVTGVVAPEPATAERAAERHLRYRAMVQALAGVRGLPAAPRPTG